MKLNLGLNTHVHIAGMHNVYTSIHTCCMYIRIHLEACTYACVCAITSQSHCKPDMVAFLYGLLTFVANIFRTCMMFVGKIIIWKYAGNGWVCFVCFEHVLFCWGYDVCFAVVMLCYVLELIIIAHFWFGTLRQTMQETITSQYLFYDQDIQNIQTIGGNPYPQSHQVLNLSMTYIYICAHML